MRYSFEETKNKAADTLDDMERRLARMNRQYDNYIKHGAADSAEEIKEKIDALAQEIESEQDAFRQAFY